MSNDARASVAVDVETGPREISQQLNDLTKASIPSSSFQHKYTLLVAKHTKIRKTLQRETDTLRQQLSQLRLLLVSTDADALAARNLVDKYKIMVDGIVGVVGACSKCSKRILKGRSEAGGRGRRREPEIQQRQGSTTSTNNSQKVVHTSASNSSLRQPSGGVNGRNVVAAYNNNEPISTLKPQSSSSSSPSVESFGSQDHFDEPDLKSIASLKEYISSVITPKQPPPISTSLIPDPTLAQTELLQLQSHQNSQRHQPDNFTTVKATDAATLLEMKQELAILRVKVKEYEAFEELLDCASCADASAVMSRIASNDALVLGKDKGGAAAGYEVGSSIDDINHQNTGQDHLQHQPHHSDQQLHIIPPVEKHYPLPPNLIINKPTNVTPKLPPPSLSHSISKSTSLLVAHDISSSSMYNTNNNTIDTNSSTSESIPIPVSSHDHHQTQNILNHNVTSSSLGRDFKAVYRSASKEIIMERQNSGGGNGGREKESSTKNLHYSSSFQESSSSPQIRWKSVSIDSLSSKSNAANSSSTSGSLTPLSLAYSSSHGFLSASAPPPPPTPLQPVPTDGVRMSSGSSPSPPSSAKDELISQLQMDRDRLEEELIQRYAEIRQLISLKVVDR